MDKEHIAALAARGGQIKTNTAEQTLAHRRIGLVHHSRSSPLMSAMGHKRTLRLVGLMSALPPAWRQLDVRFVPITDMQRWITRSMNWPHKSMPADFPG